MQQLPILVPNDPSNKILLAFCQQLVTNISPKYIPNCVAIDSQKGDCFHNVAKYQSQYGGDVQYGWCLWETPGLILQAEFHAVWRSATGELVDLTPHHQILEKGIILFLPDNTRSYEGIRVNNQRIALLDDPVIHNYLLAQEALFLETQHYMNDQRIKLDTDQQCHAAVDQVNNVLKQFENAQLAIERLIKKRFPRNEHCPCGSGVKTKNCCYSTSRCRTH